VTDSQPVTTELNYITRLLQARHTIHTEPTHSAHRALQRTHTCNYAVCTPEQLTGKYRIYSPVWETVHCPKLVTASIILLFIYY